MSAKVVPFEFVFKMWVVMKERL